jgi:hypothetical protein
MYELDGIVANTIDTFVEFAITDFKFNGVKNDTLKDLLNYFIKFVNKDNPLTERGLKKVGEYSSLQYYTAGNVFVEPKWARERLQLQKGRKKIFEVPTSVHFYDPQKIYIDVTAGNMAVLVTVSEVLSQAISILKEKNGRQSLKTALSLPKSVVNSFKNDGINGGRIILEDVVSIQRKKAPFNNWGIPYIARAFRTLAIKHKLQNLDMDTIDGLINHITIFKIGSEKFPSRPGRLNAFSQLMNSSSATRMLVWGHDIDALTVGPKDSVVDMPPRYLQINADILEDLGLPKAFTTSPGASSSGDPWVHILRLMSRLSRHRNSIAIMFEDWAIQIALRNGFKPGKDFEDIRVHWKRQNLMNPADVRQFIVQLYDRGLITRKTALWETDRDFDQEILNRIDEIDTKFTVDGEEVSVDELLSPPALPFSKNEKDDVSDEDGRPPGEKTDEKEDEKTTNLKEDV